MLGVVGRPGWPRSRRDSRPRSKSPDGVHISPALSAVDRLAPPRSPARRLPARRAPALRRQVALFHGQEFDDSAGAGDHRRLAVGPQGGGGGVERRDRFEGHITDFHSDSGSSFVSPGAPDSCPPPPWPSSAPPPQPVARRAARMSENGTMCRSCSEFSML